MPYPIHLAIRPLQVVLGVAVGGAATYLWKDDGAREKLTSTGAKLKQGISSGANSVVNVFKSKSKDDAEATVEENSAAVETPADDSASQEAASEEAEAKKKPD